MSMVAESEIADLIARVQVSDCLLKYCRGMDRRDMALLRSVFWPDAAVDYGFFKGNAYQFFDETIPQLAIMDTTHVVTNMLTRTRGDVAEAEACFCASHRFKSGPEVGPNAGKEVIVGGRYIDRFERREGEWRFADRVLIFELYREGPDASFRPFFGTTAENAQIGRAGPDDYSYVIFGREGPSA